MILLAWIWRHLKAGKPLIERKPTTWGHSRACPCCTAPGRATR
jgi:hypothetical protein